MGRRNEKVGNYNLDFAFLNSEFLDIFTLTLQLNIFFISGQVLLIRVIVKFLIETYEMMNKLKSVVFLQFFVVGLKARFRLINCLKYSEHTIV